MRALLGFLDETGFSDRPTVRRTWAKVGETPVVRVAGGWKKRTLIGMVATDPRGKKVKKFFGMLLKKDATARDIIRYLKHLKRHLNGRKLILIWDGLAAHRAKVVREYIRTQSAWLTVERTPAYAPELNPAEYIWSAIKSHDIIQAEAVTAKELEGNIRKSIRRIRRKPHVLRGCLKASGLFY